MRAVIAIPILVAAALSAAPAAAAELFTGSAVGSTAAKAATVTNEGGIQVFRGPGSKPNRRPAPEPQPIRLVHGENLWIVDSANKKVTGCELRNSTQVATSIIRCTTRKLSVLR